MGTDLRQKSFFGTGVAGKSLAINAQRRLNCYFELVQDGDKTKVAIYGTPGESLFINLGVTPVRGAWAVGLYAYVVQAGNLYKLDTLGNKSNLGMLSSSNGAVSICDNGSQLLIVDGIAGYTYTFATTSFAKITDPDFPNGATTCAFQDGFFLVENPNINGQFCKSASYDGTSWDPLDTGVMVSNSNPCIAIDSDNGYVIPWGTLSIEFWQNIGSAGFPFSPIRSAAQEYGLAAKTSRAKINSQIFFLAQNRAGQVFVGKVAPFSVQRVSNNDIENIINSFSLVSDATGFTYLLDGHPFYQINFPTAGRSFLYDDSTSFWSEVQTGTDLLARHNAQYGFAWNGKTYVTDYSNGNVYLLDPSSYTDNGTYIKRQVRTKHQSKDGNEFSIDEVWLDMEAGVGLQSGQGSDPQVALRVSKDNGRTYGVERWAPLGKVGQYQLQGPHWTRLGSAYDFVLEFTMTDPVKFAISAGYGETSQGAL